MVIDDEPLIAQLLTYQLTGAGYVVTAYQDASQALMQLAYDQPDLVLLDVMMPGVSGWDVCRQIRSGSDVPVIMLTAKSADDDVVTGLNHGADDYVCKPFTERQLLARIGAVLRRAAVAPPAGRHPVRPAPVRQPARPYPLPASLALVPALAASAAQAAPAAPPQSVAAPASDPATPRLGLALAAARSERGMSLHQAEQACGVRWEFLQALEQEQFSYMPRAQLRGALNAYSDLLGLDIDPYLGRRPRQRRRSLPTSLALSAVVVMLCLLTLLLIAL
jgi:DNA-binding response OmpR family regulator